MKFVQLFLALGGSMIVAGAALAQHSDLPNPTGPDPRTSMPVDHSLTNSPCGSAANEISSVCRNGMVFNKEGNVERRKEVVEQQRAEVRAVMEQRKAAAKSLAERVLAGAEVPPGLVEQIRTGLGRDIDLWRAADGISDKEWDAAKTRWLREPSSLTPAEWVLWRASWFDERDKWLAAHAKGH